MSEDRRQITEGRKKIYYYSKELGMELHFYPGINKLVVKDKSGIKAQYEAYGGPSVSISGHIMDENPTTAGSFVIHGIQVYRTPTWAWSRIKWGTPIALSPDRKDVWYKLLSGKWASVEKDTGITLAEIKASYMRLYNRPGIPSTWIFNDFGPVAIRYYKDLNGNKTLDGPERLSGEMIHTTPQDEANHAKGKPVNLTYSHGCIHIKPSDRNLLESMGLFKKGSTFIVHKYSEIRIK